ncbi:MAG: four helix bundle protein [Chthoniobacterales bacterium]|nr:four helix bundle protein [Chthoniobacterales bacterium]
MKVSFAERFEELEIWREARSLHKQVHLALRGCKDYSFRDQMRRAALSVMNDIAEGFERRTKKDFAHFLDLAKGLSGEVRSMTFAAEDVAILR